MKMLPLILGGAALAGGVWWLFGHHDAAADKAVPKQIVEAVAAALASGDPEAMKATAAKLRSEGYANQAASLEDAAKELHAAIQSTPRAHAGVKQGPVLGKGKPRVLNPAPRADDPDARRQAGQLAQLLTGLTSDDLVRPDVKRAIADYQKSEKDRRFYVGNLDGLYGPKTAITLAQDHGIVPPRPLVWPRKDTAGAKAAYVQQLASFAAADPQRREEWQQASHLDE